MTRLFIWFTICFPKGVSGGEARLAFEIIEEACGKVYELKRIHDDTYSFLLLTDPDFENLKYQLQRAGFTVVMIAMDNGDILMQRDDYAVFLQNSSTKLPLSKHSKVQNSSGESD